MVLSDELLEGVSERAAAAVRKRGQQLSVEWFLCSDHKLICTAMGHGGSGCSRPCPWCDWQRGGNSEQDLQHRTQAEAAQAAQWSVQYAEPLRALDREV